MNFHENAHEISFFSTSNAKPSKRDCALRGKSRRQLSSSINIHSVNSYTSSRFFHFSRSKWSKMCHRSGKGDI